MRTPLFALFLFTFWPLFLWADSFSGQVLDNETDLPLEGVNIWLQEADLFSVTDAEGKFYFNDLEDKSYTFTLYKENYITITQVENITKDSFFIYKMKKLELELDVIEVNSNRESFGLSQLRNVEGTAIYAGKKTEVIPLENLTANLAVNNAREIYKNIAGLNIWENDGGGMQLSIGARGLDPNRTANFNTRQNGYDISADALGYPESYYTPPTQALERIELVRGAASLQYGPQFGGLLNFVFKKGNKKKPLEVVTENTIGSFGLWSNFVSIGGSKNGFNYYTFYQRKQGNGWRPFSSFYQNTAYAQLSKSFSEKLKIGLEYTYMNYLSQQPGGLQDFQFQSNPRQSLRERNWFQVNWNLASVNLNYKITDKTKINSKGFFLLAGRNALGELGPIHRPDPLTERDLIKGLYQNFGNETRLLHRYSINNKISNFLLGFRYYHGQAQSEQGLGSDGNEADFNFLNPDDLEKSSYEFPSNNLALFSENLFQVTERWTLTPGIRFEYIKTQSDGFFKERVFSGGEVIAENKFDSHRRNARSFFLLGLGTEFQSTLTTEAYGNFSQNYRSINFTDLAISNPNLLVDSLLKDERGYNLDLGWRGSLFSGFLKFDISLFYLRYKNRIGMGELVIPDPIVLERAVAYRTNIGDARIYGLETYLEANFWKWIKPKDQSSHLSTFLNLSYINGKYVSGLNSFIGNQVEWIPPVSIKTGISFKYKNFSGSYQLAYVAKHFSDATNAEFVVNATRGIIPAYSVQDISISYEWKRFRFQAGANNLTDAAYFTRRAASYPGPGIIPAEGRSFYGTVRMKF